MALHKMGFAIGDVVLPLISEGVKVPQRGHEGQVKPRVLVQEVTDHLDRSSAQIPYFDQILLEKPGRTRSLVLLSQGFISQTIFMPCCLVSVPDLLKAHTRSSFLQETNDCSGLAGQKFWRWMKRDLWL